MLGQPVHIANLLSVKNSCSQYGTTDCFVTTKHERYRNPSNTV